MATKITAFFFLDSNQELLTLEPESEVTISLEILSTNTNVPATAFSNLIATKTIKDTKTAAPFTYEQLGVPGKGIVEELLSVSAHTLPPMKMLCTSFITSLLSSSVSKTQSIDDKVDKDNITQKDLQEDSAEESEGELSRSKKQESPRVIEINDVDETKVQLVDHNWSFLSTILPDREEIEH